MRRNLVMLVVLLAVPLVAGPSPNAAAQQPPGPIRFVPAAPEASVKVNGKYPPKPDLCPARQPGSLHAAYRGVLEVGRRPNGQLYLVTELTFPEYLNGIAEVPRDWPAEALKAQVVAARTYAISHMNPSTALAKELRYDLCSTDACQVYRGLNVERGAWGSAWSKAVADTQGEILRYEGKPAQTFYFSTSNGQTYSNAEGFGGTALPYLKGVAEQDDTQSPTSNWSVRMPLSDLTATLKLADAWTGGAISSIKQEGDKITVSGEGPEQSMTFTEFRNRLNSQAVCLTPKRYPTAAPGGGTLPQVIPSKWGNVEQQGQDVVISGRGWGHGVGMVQWGLKGKAEKGMNHADMLAYYFAGLRPEKVAEPDKIRVSLATELDEITIERKGPVTVEGAAVPDGPVKIRGGASMAIESGEPIAPRLKVDSVTAAPAPEPAGATALSYSLSAPANVLVEYRGPEQGSTPAEPRPKGAQTSLWDPAATQLPPGTYELTMVANDGVDDIRSGVLTAQVAPPAPPSPSPENSPSSEAQPSPDPRPASSTGSPSPFFFIGITCLALAAILAAYLVIRARKGG